MEDLLRASNLEDSGNWYEFLPLIEFTCNNSFRSSTGMAPYEVLYGWKCRTPLCRYKTREKFILGPKLVQQTTEKIKMDQEKMRATQSIQKSFVDQKRRPLEFQEGDRVFFEN